MRDDKKKKKNRSWRAWLRDRKTEENMEKHLKKQEKLCMIAIVSEFRKDKA